jgi:hypothetical protein
MYMLPVSGLLFLAWRLLVWGIYAIGRRGLKDFASRMGEINKLPLEDARGKAEEALRDARIFACTGAEQEPPSIARELGGHVVGLFSRYKEIKVVGEETVLGWDHIGDSEYASGLVRIGTDMEFTEYAVRPGADGIFELDNPPENIGELREPLYATIYHLIVSIHESMNDDDSGMGGRRQ